MLRVLRHVNGNRRLGTGGQTLGTRQAAQSQSAINEQAAPLRRQLSDHGVKKRRAMNKLFVSQWLLSAEVNGFYLQSRKNVNQNLNA